MVADEIGYPVMIKASAGGGGKGMRIAHAGRGRRGLSRARVRRRSPRSATTACSSRSSSRTRAISKSRCSGDKHGNVIHLGERECSIQRRNQKVVEEAPSPLLDAATRSKMGEQAVALAKAVGYDSAGTVEFVAGQDSSFYFLEMNTRLQVEHPVTELVTGIDLVEQMIRVAAGEKLALTQSDVKLNGLGGRDPHLCRGPVPQLPAVDRPAGALSAAGGSAAGGITVRNDTGVYEGGEISLFYDPMIAKLVTHAPTRAAAIAAQADALDAFVIDGIRHNIPFLAALMQHPRWRAASSRPASSPRNSRTASIRSRRPARRRRRWRRSRPPSTTCSANASGASPARGRSRR